MFILVSAANGGEERMINVHRIEAVYVEDNVTVLATNNTLYYVKESYTEIKKRIGEALLCEELDL